MDSPPRLDAFAIAPVGMAAMIEFELKMRALSLEPSLCTLIKIRASQLNGCSYCLGMHEREALAAGEATSRIDQLSRWREADLFTDRECAALTWVDTLTLVSSARAPDADYEVFAREFTPEEQVEVTLVICSINSWNRIAIGFRTAS